MAELLYRIGRFAARRRLVAIAAWLSMLVVAGAGFAIGGSTPTGDITIPGTPTERVTERLAAAFPDAAGGTGTVVFHTSDGTPFTDEQQAAISASIAGAAETDGVARIVDPFATQAERDAQAAAIADGQTQLEQARAQLEASAAQLEAGQVQLEAGQAQLEAGQAELDAARAQAEAAGALTPEVEAQLDAKQAGIDQGWTLLEEQRAQLEAGQAQLEAGQAQLEAGQAQLEEEAQKLEAGAALLEASSGIRLVSEDGTAALAAVQFSDPQSQVPQATKDALIAAFEAAPIAGVDIDFSSEITFGIPNLFGIGEAIGLVVAGVVLLVMLGTLVGAGLPIITAVLGVAIGILGALAFSSVVDMLSVTPVLGVMLGLAVGIDYALFIVNRHRRQLKDGYTVDESIALANGTSGNAVVFAGSTVIIALVALNVTGIPFIGLMGTIAAACVAIAVLIAVTLTPALLSLAGMRVLRRSERDRVAAQTGPAPVAPARPMSTGQAIGRVLVGVLALVLIAVPALSLRLGLPVGSSEAADSTQRQAYDIVAEKFGPGVNGPLLVVADLPGTPTEDEALAYQVRIAQQVAAFPDVIAVAPIGTSPDGTIVAFQVIPAEGPASESTEQLVRDLRAASPLDGDIAIGVAGQASGNIDISQKLADALPLYLLLVVGLSLLIMIVVFRSLLVPVIATGGFVLSLFAALGGVVAIYQWGWLGGLFGVSAPGPILNFLPTALVGILFGLAMDYTLFLASGMREAYVHGAPARTAVVLGFRAARSVVTAAAIIMVAVFGGFIFAESALVRPIGFALAFGVLVDAFVVRMLVLPALMHLSGEWAWWLPRWLDRLIPDVDVEGAGLERRHPHVAAEHLGERPAPTATDEPAPAYVTADDQT